MCAFVSSLGCKNKGTNNVAINAHRSRVGVGVTYFFLFFSISHFKGSKNWAFCLVLVGRVAQPGTRSRRNDRVIRRGFMFLWFARPQKRTATVERFWGPILGCSFVYCTRPPQPELHQFTAERRRQFRAQCEKHHPPRAHRTISSPSVPSVLGRPNPMHKIRTALQQQQPSFRAFPCATGTAATNNNDDDDDDNRVPKRFNVPQ